MNNFKESQKLKLAALESPQKRNTKRGEKSSTNTKRKREERNFSTKGTTLSTRNDYIAMINILYKC